MKNKINPAVVNVIAPSVMTTIVPDGRPYPQLVWVVVDTDGEFTYFTGEQTNWQVAQSYAIAKGLPFDGSRAVLTGPPDRGRWYVPDASAIAPADVALSDAVAAHDTAAAATETVATVD